MKQKILIGLLFSSVFVVSLIVHVPLSFVFKYITLPPTFQMSTAQGNLWNGNIKDVKWKGQSLGDVQWNIRTFKLLLAKLEASVQIGNNPHAEFYGKGIAGIGITRRPYLKDFVANLDAEKVTQYMNISFPVTTKGRMELSLKEYQYDTPWCDNADGVLVWKNSQISFPFGSLDLGPVNAQLTCEDNQANIQGGQNNTQASSEFSIQSNEDRSYAIQAWFKPEKEFPSSLERQLTWLGNPDIQGRYQFKYQGQL